MNYHVIYIPGLGDSADDFRRKGLKIWSLFAGISTELVPSNWLSEPTVDEKLARIHSAIERAYVDGKKVVLVGESGGAASALVAAAHSAHVSKVVTICGVTSPRMTIGPAYRRRAPALQQMVHSLHGLKQTAKLHSIRGLIDTTVLKKYSVAEGAKEHVFLTIGHMTTIVLCLTLLSPLVIRIVKQ